MAETIVNGSLLVVDKAGRIADLILDCVLSESHKAEVEVTSHAVEDGSDISDHARQKPREVTITGLVTETPINIVQFQRVIQSQGTRIETLASQPVARGSKQYVEAALAKLDRMLAERQLISIVTSIRKYDNMMLTSVTIPRDPKTGDALSFTAVAREIRFATIRTIEAQTKKVQTANKKVKLGKQVATPEPVDKRSILKRINDATKGFLTTHVAPPGTP